MTKSLYAQDGVNVDDESDFSSYAGKICKDTYKNSKFVKVHDLSEGGFRGPRPVTFENLPDGYMIESTVDSVGSKGVLADAADAFDTLAYDLVGTSSSDVTRFGGVPLVFTNILDVVSVGAPGSEENEKYKKLIKGLKKVADEQNLVVLKGETCQLTQCIGSDIKDSKTKVNWGGCMIGAYHKDKMITGNNVKEGQVVIALKENGFRCNGISSIRKAFKMKFGEEWWNNPDAKDLLKQAAAPSVLYDNFLTTLNGWYDKDFKEEIKVHAILHLSGGGIKEKFANDLILERGLSAELTDLWEPVDIMKKVAEWRGMEDEEFYQAWHGGQGMLLIVDESDAEKCVSRAKYFSIEAKIAGKITKENNPQVKVNSKLSGKDFMYKN